MVHLKTCRSLGQRTRDPHVIQFPVLKSLLPTEEPVLCPLVCGRLELETGGASSESESEFFLGMLLDFFFLIENNEGKG